MIKLKGQRSKLKVDGNQLSALSLELLANSDKILSLKEIESGM
jgi:hypothetical protein